MVSRLSEHERDCPALLPLSVPVVGSAGGREHAVEFRHLPSAPAACSLRAVSTPAAHGEGFPLRKHDIHREVLDNLSDGVLVVGLGGRIETLNPAAEQILGLKSGEAQGQTFAELFITREGFDDFTQLLLDATAQRSDVERRVIEVRGDGEARSLSVATSYGHSYSLWSSAAPRCDAPSSWCSKPSMPRALECRVYRSPCPPDGTFTTNAGLNVWPSTRLYPCGLAMMRVARTHSSTGSCMCPWTHSGGW